MGQTVAAVLSLSAELCVNSVVVWYGEASQRAVSWVEVVTFEHYHCCRPSQRNPPLRLSVSLGVSPCNYCRYLREYKGSDSAGGGCPVPPPPPLPASKNIGFLFRNASGPPCLSESPPGFRTSGVFRAGSQTAVHQKSETVTPTSRRIARSCRPASLCFHLSICPLL